VRAELTVSFIGLKVGPFTGDAPTWLVVIFDDLQADPTCWSSTTLMREVG
jgi:NAD(P)H-hydrate epimerase